MSIKEEGEEEGKEKRGGYIIDKRKKRRSMAARRQERNPEDKELEAQQGDLYDVTKVCLGRGGEEEEGEYKVM